MIHRTIISPNELYEGRTATYAELAAMAARGYWQAYRVVEQSIGNVLKSQNPGEVAREDHRAWYRALFAPSVAAGLLRP